MCHQAIACADEAQRLLVTGQYAAAAVQLQQAIGLGLLSAHAHEAWLLIYGREDVAMNQERAFQLAGEGVRLGCYHCQGVLAYCYWGGYGCDANETRSLELAIESSNKDDDKHWLTYWMIYGSYHTIDTFIGFIFNFIPYFGLVRIGLFIWLIQFNGSQWVYENVLVKVLQENKELIA